MRIRSIKPEFWSSEDIAALPWDTRLVFIGLWSYVDDNGVGRDIDKLISADLFPLEEDPRDTLATVSRGLQTLSDASHITRYKVGGRPYLHIVAWDKHQKIDKPAKERYPLPTCDDAVIRDTLATVSRDPRAWNRGTGEQGNRGTGEEDLLTGCAVERARPPRFLPLRRILGRLPPQGRQGSCPQGMAPSAEERRPPPNHRRRPAPRPRPQLRRAVLPPPLEVAQRRPVGRPPAPRPQSQRRPSHRHRQGHGLAHRRPEPHRRLPRQTEGAQPVTTNANRRAAAAALGKIALLDRFPQEPQPAVIEAWAELLAEHNLDSTDDALAAVKAHALASPKPPTPHDLVTAMRNIRRDRQARETDDERQTRYRVIDAKAAGPVVELASVNDAAAEHRKAQIAAFAHGRGRIPDDAA